MPGVAVVIPTLNERDAIGPVVAEIPRDIAFEIIVADSGSHDGTQDAAREAGARVVDLGRRGYGLACAKAAEAADPACDIIVFLDGDGADRADLMHRLVDPIRAGTHDFVIASRTRGERDPGSMSWHQVLAGQAAGLGMRVLYGVRYSDMCAFRAIRRDALAALNLREMTYGWNIEMQMQAARAGLRILGGPGAIPMPFGGRKQGGGFVSRHPESWVADRDDLRPGRFVSASRHLKRGVCLALLLALPAMGSLSADAEDQGIMGRWWTQDHDGVIELRACGEGVCGRVVGVTTFRPDGSADLDNLGRSRCQLQIIPGGTLRNDGIWASHITNPDNGKTYTTQMSVDDRGRLKMRGYVGLPLFGETNYWTRFTGRLSRDCHIGQ